MNTRRFAAHFIYLSENEVYKLHFVELNDRNQILRIAPLSEEIARTSFFSGSIFIANPGEPFSIETFRNQKLNHDKSVELYRSNSVNFFSPELGTSNCRSDRHIQRLG